MALFGRKKKVAAPTDEAVPEPTLPEAPEPDGDGRRTVDAHRDYVLGLVQPLPPFGMALLDAWGLALCESVPAATDLPAFDSATVDGYGVRAEDVAGATQGEPRGLTLRPGAATGPLTTGKATPVAAGQPMPEGADCVLPKEFTTAKGQRLRVLEPVVAGENVRARASLMVDGDKVLEQGRVLDARSIGLLAEAGVDKVLARPRPRVVVVSIGSDLVDPSRRLTSPEQHFDATSYMLAAAAKAEGCQVWRVAVDSEDVTRVREVIGDQLIRADLVITTGGLEGAAVLEQVAPGLGRCDITDLALQPGSRQGFGLMGDDEVPLLMLPSNPTGALVGFHAFGRPVIRTLMGVEPVTPVNQRAITTTIVRSTPGVFTAIPAFVREEGGRHSVDLVHGDHPSANLATANALVVLAEGAEDVPAGQPVVVWMIDRD